MSFDIRSYLSRCQRAVDDRLETLLPVGNEDGRDQLAAAMRHAVLGGGKRLRPALAMAACEAVGGLGADALSGACALELVHAYSLVHDDLPAMDDDVERRGRPTVHVAFGEATAILAGDALLTLAFETLADSPTGAPTRVLGALSELARCAGRAGLVGGQCLDLAAAGRRPETLDDLERIHRGKTAALFRAAASVGGHLGGAEPEAQAILEAYGAELGLAFQHADDILDMEHRHLAEASSRRLAELLELARQRAGHFGSRGQPLHGLADLVEAYAGKGSI